MNEWEKWEYRIALAKAKFRRVLLSSFFLRPRSWTQRKEVIPFPIVSFSGARDFPELFFSLQSFLHFAGIPKMIHVVSDGSINENHSALLSSCFPNIHVTSWKEMEKNVENKGLLQFSQKHPLGKKFATIIHFHSMGPFLFCDSDVLFFLGARHLSKHLNASSNLFLEDYAPAFDPRIPQEKKNCPSTNTGFLFLAQPIPWYEELASIKRECLETPLHHTEQTIIHLALQKTSSKPLDRKRFIVNVSDQFLVSDSFYSPLIFLRHYVQPVRHKFWNLPLKYYLRIFLKHESIT